MNKAIKVYRAKHTGSIVIKTDYPGNPQFRGRCPAIHGLDDESALEIFRQIWQLFLDEAK